MTSTSHSITIRAAIPVLMVPTCMPACQTPHTLSVISYSFNFFFFFWVWWGLSLFLTKISVLTHLALVFTVCCVCVSCVSSSIIHVFVDNPLCVSVPPHDVKRMAWNSTGNSSCPDSELSQSSMPAAPLGSNTVAAINNTKQSKNTVLTNPAFCWLPVTAARLNIASQTSVLMTSEWLHQSQLVWGMFPFILSTVRK